MISWMTNFIVVFILLISIATADDPCRFEYPGKGVIDITTLGHTDGSAAFADQFTKPPSNYSIKILFEISRFLKQLLFFLEYSYNPCKPFTSSFYCQNVAACQSEYSSRMNCSFNFRKNFLSSYVRWIRFVCSWRSRQCNMESGK